MAIHRSPGPHLDVLASSAPPVPLASTAARKAVLVVEDDRFVRESLGLILDHDYEVRYAEDGPQALDQLRAHRPNAVLLDLGLPSMDGLDVLDRVKAIAPGLPVIVVTISSGTDIIVGAVKRGAFDYVTKPYDEPTLLAKVRQALGERTGVLAPDPDPGESAAWGGAEFAARPRCLILVADPGTAGTLSVALARSVATEVAPNGIRAARLLGSRVDCVVCDDGAWEGHGYAFLGAVRDRYPRPRIVLLTAEPSLLGAADRTGLVDDLVPPNTEAAQIVRRALAHCLGRSPADLPDLAPGPHVAAAMEYLRAHYAGDLGIRDVARAIGVSRGYLTREFQAQLGLSASQYLACLRVEVAKLLLQGPRAKLDEIAARAGFGDPSHLSRVFRAHTGSRPGTYRRQLGLQ